jgi:hypothetical protein
MHVLLAAPGQSSWHVGSTSQVCNVQAIMRRAEYWGAEGGERQSDGDKASRAAYNEGDFRPQLQGSRTNP